MKNILNTTTYHLQPTTKRGFTLIEIIVSLGLAALILPALAYIYTFSVRTSVQGQKYSQAYALAQEQMEAVYYIKDSWIWDNTDPVNTAANEYYQPKKDGGGNWSLDVTTTTPDSDFNGFISTIEIQKVDRDGSDNSIGSGYEDYKTRKIISSVSWKMNGADEEVSVSSYVTKH